MNVRRKNGGLVRAKKTMEVEVFDDEYYMRRCVELARKAIGCTSPNPMVGCVIVKDEKIVGEGFHPKAGEPHAEVFALREAGDLAENATAYVSLEPCNHYGRTPPCSEALIEAKVKRVVVGMIDPNPMVASKGVDRLRSAGIDVTVGVEEELCKSLNEAFIHRMLTGKPFVALRYSFCKNGRLQDMIGEGASERGGYYSKLLQEYDAVLYSSSVTETFSQEPGANQPLQIIVSSDPSSLLTGLTEERASNTVIFTNKETIPESETAQRGVETVVLDRINLNSILDYCKSRGLLSVLVDLRRSSTDLEALVIDALEQDMFQKVIMETVPIWDGNTLTAFNSQLKRIKVTDVQTRRLDWVRHTSQK